MRKLDILIPMYNEGQDVVKPLLDSLIPQQNIDFKDFGVIICCDGGSTELSEEFINSYPFKIEFHMCEHQGVSATRNECLKYSHADYVMWCDCDDIFYMNCALWVIFREIDQGFDSLVSCFLEETRIQGTNEITYINREMDSTFVHGKVHRRKYLDEQNIRWNPELTIHEDSYFNIQCQKLSTNVKYCSTPFYLWKWRDDSVCRHDPKYILRTYNNMLDSNTALVKNFLNRARTEQAKELVTFMIFDAYFTLNKEEWINQKNQEYRAATEKRFKKYFDEFEYLYNKVDDTVKKQTIAGLKNRMFQEGMYLESITFDDWIKHIREVDKY